MLETTKKINDPDKSMPSYIHRRDEGELWSLNFEGRAFCCWKSGSPTHIGDKCRDQTRTFEEIFNENDDNSSKPTWAAVVRSGNSEMELHRKRVRDMELKIRAENQRKDNELKEAEERKRNKEIELAAKEDEEQDRIRQAIIQAQAAAAAIHSTQSVEKMGGVNDSEEVSDIDLLHALPFGAH